MSDTRYRGAKVPDAGFVLYVNTIAFVPVKGLINVQDNTRIAFKFRLQYCCAACQEYALFVAWHPHLYMTSCSKKDVASKSNNWMGGTMSVY